LVRVVTTSASSIASATGLHRPSRSAAIMGPFTSCLRGGSERAASPVSASFPKGFPSRLRGRGQLR
jgi:hypothetical protein